MATASTIRPETRLLYSPGEILDLRSHLAPQPFGNSYYEAPFNRDHLYQTPEVISRSIVRNFIFEKEMRERDSMSRATPSAEAYLDAKGIDHKAAIQVIKHVAAGPKEGAQVLICNVPRPPGEYWRSMGWHEDDFPGTVVAKDFDPLYFPSITTASRNDIRLDVVSLADKQYAHEAAAYIEIHGSRGENPVVDDSTPKFYGTFTSTIKDPNSAKTRQVRIVLLEYVEGTSLAAMCTVRHRPGDSAYLVPTEKAGNLKERLEVFARMLHCSVALEKIGVSRRSFDPRDILVANDKIGGGKRVVITNFSHTQIVRYMKHASALCTYLPRPLHPRWRYGIDAFEKFWRLPFFLDDESTDSDSELECHSDDEAEGAGPSFTKWANRYFILEDFVLAEEADVFAEQYEEERHQKVEKMAQGHEGSEPSSPNTTHDYLGTRTAQLLHPTIPLRVWRARKPFGEEWYKPPFDIASMDLNAMKPSELTPQDFVFTKQPRDRDPRSPIPPFAQLYFDAGSHGHEISLRILENKPTGRATGSQLVLCEVQTSPSEYWRAMGWEDSSFPSQVIAKIFDPLLCSTTLSHHGKRWDPVSWADKQHAHEAAAYIEIHGHRKEHPIVDDVTPNFYGSFSMTLESPPSDNHPRRFRHVRAVLLEHIHAFRFGIRSFNQFGGWFPEEWLDFEETYSEIDSDSETDSDTHSDSKTHSDSRSHPDDQGPGPSFEAWALKTFSEKDFVMEDEADEIAEQYNKMMQERESTETSGLQPAENSSTASPPIGFMIHRLNLSGIKGQLSHSNRQTGTAGRLGLGFTLGLPS
ncbi:hypothetical protein B0T11DRAFT_296377 [Plectosphaerella cucumerina]|uniref:Uncharacterized protein n=1 Tax=Plectosphaerella cucumerina TaxID=40658 RepID=A0A8K0TP28_9PEZI|nr:hypothetical protein B0T11DRAFT_296377 [Plectosphaerella cucumerina]